MTSSGLVSIAQMARIGSATARWCLHASTVGIGFWAELFQQAGAILTLLYVVRAGTLKYLKTLDAFVLL
jgi:hypothetical protein